MFLKLWYVYKLYFNAPSHYAHMIEMSNRINFCIFDVYCLHQMSIIDGIRLKLGLNVNDKPQWL